MKGFGLWIFAYVVACFNLWYLYDAYLKDPSAILIGLVTTFLTIVMSMTVATGFYVYDLFRSKIH